MQGTECVRDQTIKQVVQQHPGQAIEVGPTVGSGAQVEVQRIEGKIITQFETPYASTAAVQGPVGPVAMGEKETISTGVPGAMGGEYGAAVTQTTTLPAPPVPAGGQIQTGVTGGVTGLSSGQTVAGGALETTQIAGAPAQAPLSQQSMETRTGTTAGSVATPGMGGYSVAKGTEIELQAGTIAYAYQSAGGQWKAIVPVDLGESRPLSGSLGRVYNTAQEALGPLAGSERVRVRLEAGSKVPLFESRDMGWFSLVPVDIHGGREMGTTGTTTTGAMGMQTAQTGMAGTAGTREEVVCHKTTL